MLKILTMAAVFMTVGAMNVEAAEFKGVAKGSIREKFPDLIYVASAYDHSTYYAGTINDYIDKIVQSYGNQAMNASKEKAIEYCNGNAQYAAIDNYGEAVTFNSNGGILFTASANVICFNLPEKVPAKTTKK